MKPGRQTGTTSQRAPCVFLSYTHESSEHKEWVLRLASDLRRNGVDAVLDKWECKYGSDLALFMEKGISNADRVLLVCTPTYKKKANSAKGGVGYERLVVTAEIAKNIRTKKFVCVLRSGSQTSSMPTFAGNRLYLDFRSEGEYKGRLEELLRDLHAFPSSPKPPVGPNPFGKSKVKISVSKRSSADSPIAKPPLGSNPFRPPENRAMAPVRRRMPETRMAITHKFDIAGHEGLLTVGLFEDGKPGEILLKMSKEGSTVGGLVDAIALLTSLALQYGVPLEVFVKKFSHQRFEPSGFTKNPEIRQASSITDYVFRWLAFNFLPGYRESMTALHSPSLRFQKGRNAADGVQDSQKQSGPIQRASR